jgi:hypothetical protein
MRRHCSAARTNRGQRRRRWWLRHPKHSLTKVLVAETVSSDSDVDEISPVLRHSAVLIGAGVDVISSSTRRFFTMSRLSRSPTVLSMVAIKPVKLGGS